MLHKSITERSMTPAAVTLMMVELNRTGGSICVNDYTVVKII